MEGLDFVPRIYLVSLALIVACGAVSCSSSDQAKDPLVEELSSKMTRLQPDETVTEVKRQLGKPTTEFLDENSTGSLNYGRWRVFFSRGALTHWTREVTRRRQGSRGGAFSNGAVLRLRPGVSWKSVRNRLGEPEVMELDYAGSRTPERVARYGPWELRFQDEALRMRTQW